MAIHSLVWTRTYADEQLFDGEWMDGYQIVSNDGQVVVVNPESEAGCDSAVDQLEDVFLSGSECRIIIVGRVCAAVEMAYTIDKYAVSGRRWVGRILRHFLLISDKGILMDPI